VGESEGSHPTFSKGHANSLEGGFSPTKSLVGKELGVAMPGVPAGQGCCRMLSRQAPLPQPMAQGPRTPGNRPGVAGDRSFRTTSEVTTRFITRFQRYRGSIFRFLEESSIPWNNNTGERALRHLAVQRKISGSFFKSFSSGYLVLLGIAQTCRFQGKSFLKFLPCPLRKALGTSPRPPRMNTPAAADHGKKNCRGDHIG
jgi:hypothetical protein